MVAYTRDVVKATLHRALPISPGSSPLAPHPHLNLSCPSAGFLSTELPWTVICAWTAPPQFLGLLSSPLGHSSGAISFSKTRLFPTPAFLLCPLTPCLSTFPVIKLCQNCPYAPPICLSQWTLRLRCGTQNLALLGFHHLGPHCN